MRVRDSLNMGKKVVRNTISVWSSLWIPMVRNAAIIIGFWPYVLNFRGMEQVTVASDDTREFVTGVATVQSCSRRREVE